MAYTEMEQFLGRGNEKIFWILSLKDIGGAAVGGFVGQHLGSLAVGSGLLVVGATLIGAAIGLVCMMQYHGLANMKRLSIYLRYLWRRLRGTNVIAGGVDDEAPVIVRSVQHRALRQDGSVLFRPRYGNKPLPSEGVTVALVATEPPLSEAELSEDAERLRALLDGVPSGPSLMADFVTNDVVAHRKA